jgi:hypothetical protein
MLDAPVRCCSQQIVRQEDIVKTRYALAIAATTVMAAIPTAGWAAGRAAPNQEYPCTDAAWMQEHMGDMDEHWAQMNELMGTAGMMGGTGMPHHPNGSMPFNPGS